MTQAEALRGRGQLAEAEHMLREILAAAPGHVPAFIALAVCARQRGDRAAAMRWFQQAAAAEPANLNWQIEAATEQCESGHAAAAREALQQLLAHAPNHLGALLALAYCARKLGDHQASLHWYQAAAAVDPINIAIRLAIAADLQALGQLDQAEPAFRQILMAVPGNLEALQGAATCARLRGAPARALPHLREAVALDPDNSHLRLALGDTLRDADLLDEADVTLRQVLAMTSNRVPGFISLAVCARKRQDHAAARDWFAQAAAAEPDNLDWQAEIAGEQAELGQLDQAETGFHAMLATAPGHPRALLGLAHCAHKRGDHAASLRWYREAAAIDPDNLEIRLAIAADLRELGQLDAATSQFHEVLAASAGNVKALQGLAACAAKRGTPRAAILYLREAIALLPQDPWLSIDLAAQLRELGQLHEAEQTYRRLLQTSPSHVHAHLGLGQLARLRNDRAAALAHFIAADAAGPGDLSAGLAIAAEQREAGDIAAARATGATLLARHPGNLYALLSRGQTERHAGDDAAALAAFRAAHEAVPSSSEPLVELAAQLRLMGQQAACDQMLAQALELNPRSVPALMRLAEQAMIAGDLAKSYELSMRAATIEPAEINAHLAAIESVARMARPGEALQMLAALQTQRGPMPAIIIKHLALLRQCGATLAALQLARQAVRESPHDFQLRVERFHCEMLAGADADLRASLDALAPASAHQRAAAARLRGIFAESEFRFADAIVHYQAAVTENANDSELQQSLARCELMLFNPAAARQNLRRLFEINLYENRLKNMKNISQHLYGEILEEFWLDGAATETLKRLQTEPPAARIMPVIGLVRDNEDSTAAAIGLMVALRQSGALTNAPHTAGSAAPIPKSIVQYWDDEDVPEDVAPLMRSWPEHNPDYAYRRFSDVSARAYLTENLPPQVLLAYQRGAGATQKSDIFRLAYAAREGGIYADADDRCLAPLNLLIPLHAELLLCLDNLCSAGNNFFAVRPRHPVMVQALQSVVAAINRGDHDSVWLATGPGLLTRVLATHIAQALEQRGTLPPGLTVLDPRGLRGAVATHCTPAYKFSNRHWLNAATKKRELT